MSALKFWVWLTEQNRLGGPARQALLEHFDAAGLTVRDGDTHIPKGDI